MKYKWLFLLLTVVLVLATVGGGCAEEKEKHVNFAYAGAIGDYLIIYVPKILLEEELGYTTEISDLSIAALWAGMVSGDLSTYTGVSMPNQEDTAKEYAADVEYVGTVYSPLLQGWLVPKWLAEDYGLTEISDLNDPEIAKLLDTDGDGTGDGIGCDPGWKCARIIDEEIEAYGLGDLYKQKVGAETMMRIAIEGALKKNEPILFYYWTPHPIFGTYPIGESVVWLEDPKNFWPEARADVYANREWVAENPKAAELLRQMKITDVNDISWSIAEIEANSDDPVFLEQMAREWIAKHQAEVDSWLAAVK